MRIASFRAEGEESPRLALLLPERDELLDLGSDACGIDAPASHLGWFDLDGAPLARARALHDRVRAEPAELERLRAAGAVLPCESVRLLAPVPRPGKLIGIGLNYRDHAAEQGARVPDEPLIFSKFPTAVIGPGEPVVIPPGVGFARNPPVWLRPGDVMEVEIEGLGVLRSPVVGFQAPA